MDIVRILVVLTAVILSLPLWAKDVSLYRWQDKQGQWHFGDAVDAATKPDVRVVDIAPESANVVKTKVVKTANTKVAKQVRESKSKNKVREAVLVSASQKKQECDKIRDDLRFKAFRSAERDTYDHECVSAIKW